jgi:hypothetical protein
LAIVCAAALSAIDSVSANANTIYTYTGNVFQLVTGPYTTADSVSGMIEVLNPIPNSASNETLTPISFSFSDGVQTLTNNTPGILPIFTYFYTDAAGNITMWDVELYTGAADNWMYTLNDSVDLEDDGNHGDAGLGHNDLTPGVWTVSSTTTPLPSALPLFSSALAALGLLLGWRRKRKTAPRLRPEIKTSDRILERPPRGGLFVRCGV